MEVMKVFFILWHWHLMKFSPKSLDDHQRRQNFTVLHLQSDVRHVEQKGTIIVIVATLVEKPDSLYFCLITGYKVSTTFGF